MIPIGTLLVAFSLFLQEIISERRLVPAGILDFRGRSKTKTANLTRPPRHDRGPLTLCAHAITISTRIYQIEM
jgi:hypothetical protein